MEDNMNVNTEVNTETEVEGQVEDKGSEPKTYTEAELKDLLQREADRRVTEALKKAERNKEDAVKEAQKLARMNEEEKYKYELDQREKVIAEKEKQMALMENAAEAGKALASRGISIELVDLVVAEDAETMLTNIKKLDVEFKKSVKAEVEKRLGSKAPKRNLGDDKELTQAEFRRLPLAEQAEKLENNPSIYNKYI